MTSVSINIKDYSYELPDERIAKYPLTERDASKLLCYKDGKVSEYRFTDLPAILPDNALMVFNDTKVVPARLHFVRTSGAHIEIFCLQPESPNEYSISFACTESCRWKCVIGNAKKWKGDVLMLYNPENDGHIAEMNLTASLVSRDGQTGIVEFRWSDGAAFSSVLETCGTIPIPPYLNREPEAVDATRYQTLYARIRGSVAAPTAGLHFTDRVLGGIREKGIKTDTVCLHVGAGTFLPVKDPDVARHKMHREPFTVTRSFLEDLKSGKTTICVGTTSVRTVESLYYIGVSCIESGVPKEVAQWDPYDRDYEYTPEEAIDGILSYLDRAGLDELSIGTSIFIVPGFKFHYTDILVTNFHQPESTLILLVSAFTGGEWRPIYDYALANDFRFLSYGDSSVLFRHSL